MMLNFQKRAIPVVLALFCLSVNLVFAVGPNVASGSQKTEDVIQDALPASMLYPSDFKSHDYLLWSNIKEELQHRIKFITGRHPVKLYSFCHKFQRRISKAIDRAAQENELTFSEIDNELLFGENSEITKIITPQPTLRLKICNYHSYGDITKGCILYCDAHGVDFESDFYKEHKKELEASRPAIIASDIAELIVFSPILIFPLLAVFLIIRNKKQRKLKTNI